MTTPYQRLTRLREQVTALRGKLPVSSDAGELLTEFIDLIDTALRDIVMGEPDETDEDAKATTPLTLADELWEFGCAMSRVHMGVTG